MPSDTSAVKVAIIGGGIAGLTAALRLSERGYKVTIYERERVLGGNLGAEAYNGVYHDVYAHMFCTWYENFWRIVEQDLHITREERFEPRNGVKVLRKHNGGYARLANVGSFESAWANLRSGVAPVPEMFLWAYSMLDLLAQPFHRKQILNRFSLNSFVAHRPYATEASAVLHDFILMVVWSVHSYQVSASSYRNFIKYSFRNPTPAYWLLKGNLRDTLIKPLETELLARGCVIRTGVSASEVLLRGNQVEIRFEDTDESERPEPKAGEEQRGEPVTVDYAILAVPPVMCGNLVEAGEKGHRIVDRRAHLSQLRRLYATPIPVLDLYFTRKLPGVPKEHVSLWDSGSDLTFLDLSQLWVDDPNMQDSQGRPITALTLAASDYYALPFEGGSRTAKDTADKLIKELHEYLPIFNPGRRWGDPESDIDWQKSRFQSNTAHTLYINAEGDEEWRPEASYPELPNVFFAGDFCRNAVDMATVEGAVVSGLNAARALSARVKETGKDPGTPIEVIVPKDYPRLLLLAMKLAAVPYAAGAKLWVNAIDAMDELARGRAPRGAMSSSLRLLWAPYAYVADWLETAYAIYEDSFWTAVDRVTRPPSAKDRTERQAR
jgi:hypothetical protein